MLQQLATGSQRQDETVTLLVEYSMELANRLLAGNDIKAATNHLITVIRYRPGFSTAQFLAGAAFAQLGDYRRAMSHTDNAIMLDPGNVDAMYNKAQLYMHQGEDRLAIECYRDLLSLDDRHAHAHGNLAILLHRHELNEEAGEHYRKAIALRPDVDAFRYGLSGIEGKAIPEEYVSKLFDDGADRFDSLLVDELDYRTPALLRNLLDRHLARTDYRVLDLGCGTGLSGKAIMDVAATLVGVDISAGMLDKARNKGIYSELRQEEILRYLNGCSASFDIVLASDVFNYVGDLTATFSGCRRVLATGGLFAFSAESDERHGFHMDVANLRYSHSGSYITDTAIAAGFSITEHEHVVLRKNRGKPVPGDIYLLEKA